MEALFQRRERRGLTWSELAAESGVPRSTLQWWYRRLPKRRVKRTARSAFVEVSVVDPVHQESEIEITLRSGLILRVKPGFNPDHLRRLVQTLESGC
jgi:transcriptional regulator with XRE-family HTH domain